MAEALFEDFLTCAVCLETVKEPVTLGCHHSFCSSCLYKSWDKNNTRNCPVCRRRSSKEILEVNFALRELSLSFSEQQKIKEFKVCATHPEVPPLFCKDEGRALCPVCEFSQHQLHTVVPVEKAEKELKEQLRSELQTLREKRLKVIDVQKLYQDITQHSEKQAEQCERQIRALFNRMHQFLKQEEDRAMEALREEQRRQAQTMSPGLGRIREQLASIDHTIQEVEQQLKRDTEAVLKTYNTTQVKTKTSLPIPQPVPGLLLDQAKVLGNLSYKVWKRMMSLVTYSPVILDTNTAEASLHVSEDLTSVRHGDTQLLPVVPERFTNEPIVLGSEGFSSGTHMWTVEVGDLPTWDFGVVKESIDRRGAIYAHTRYGIWCFWHGEGVYANACSQILPLIHSPEKIIVKLDYDRGEVSFYDAYDKTHIFTHRDVFTEKMFPYVSVLPAAGAKTKGIKICSTL